MFKQGLFRCLKGLDVCANAIDLRCKSPRIRHDRLQSKGLERGFAIAFVTALPHDYPGLGDRQGSYL
jgi:hypothetical protein